MIRFQVGVSVAVSGFFAVIAYNASTLKEYAIGRRKIQKRNIPTNLPAELKPPTIRQPKLQIEKLREQSKFGKETKKDDEYSWSVSGGAETFDLAFLDVLSPCEVL